MQTKKYIVQFNEANFDLIKKYCSKYHLPSLNKILDLNSTNTSSESEYHLLEPWIQWYSFYTNLPFAEHKTFNLGDCLKNSHKNFLEDYFCFFRTFCIHSFVCVLMIFIILFIINNRYWKFLYKVIMILSYFYFHELIYWFCFFVFF